MYIIPAISVVYAVVGFFSPINQFSMVLTQMNDVENISCDYDDDDNCIYVVLSFRNEHSGVLVLGVCLGK